MIFFIDEPGTLETVHTIQTSETSAAALSSECVQSPHGFTVTAFAFEEFLTYNALHYRLHSLMHSLDTENYTNLADISKEAQSLLLAGIMPPGLRMAIISAYKRLGINEPVVVSPNSVIANGEQPQQNIIDDQKDHLTVCGETNVLARVQNCFASLYTADAIRQRQRKNFVHNKAAMSVIVQKMIRLPKPAGSMDPGLLN